MVPFKTLLQNYKLSIKELHQIEEIEQSLLLYYKIRLSGSHINKLHVSCNLFGKSKPYLFVLGVVHKPRGQQGGVKNFGKVSTL